MIDNVLQALFEKKSTQMQGQKPGLEARAELCLRLKNKMDNSQKGYSSAV